jgi:hypothetical protein
MERTRGAFRVSDDPALLDLGVVHGFLRESYLYAQSGSSPPARPERRMEKLDPELYASRTC